MDPEKQIEYWLQSAEHDWDTTKSLIKEKRFDWALFLGHLVMEKVLKAVYVSRKVTFPPKTHNLIRLAEESGLSLSEQHIRFFEEVNSFHLSTRYPDEQFKFYKKCTESFTLDRITEIEESVQWLKTLI